MMRYLRNTVLVLLLSISCNVEAADASAPIVPLGDVRELNFGIISTESSAGLKKGFEPVLHDMSEQLGMKVNVFFAPDYAGVIEAMRFGKVHVAWFGNKSALEAVERAGGEVFAQTVGTNGEKGYWSLIIVHKSSPYTDIDQLIADGAKLTFGNGDPHSTSGYLVPACYLWAKRGIDPKRHFKRVRNANHETNALAVAAGQVDCATNNSESIARLTVTYPNLAESIRVIWKSPLIPKDPLVYRKDLSDEMKARIKGFFLSYGRIGPNAAEQHKKLAGMSFDWGPLHDSSNRQLLPIRELVLTKKKLEILADSRMSEIEREDRLQKIHAQLEELEQYTTLIEKYN